MRAVEASSPQPRARARVLGLGFGDLPPGPLNAITDVEGVRVGHLTLQNELGACTGITAILPHGENPVQRKVPCGLSVANGFGKLVGATQVQELGELESPILLTSTLNVFRVADGVLDQLLAMSGNENLRSVNVVVGETNDGLLNDIRSRPLTAADARRAITAAVLGPVEEGAVGAGTGTICFGWKGGIGSASRLVDLPARRYTVGVLVQSNFGGPKLMIGGREMEPGPGATRPEDGSCMMIVATDAPLDARQLTRVARRGVLAMGRLGSISSHGSGDYTIAFSTADPAAVLVPEGQLTQLFHATVDALEEAIVNSLTMAATTSGFNGRTVPGLPLQRLR
jgi:D-aminopeptidase